MGTTEQQCDRKIVVDVISGYGLDHRDDQLEARQVSDGELEFSLAGTMPDNAQIFIDRRQYRIVAQEQTGTSLDVRLEPAD